MSQRVSDQAVGGLALGAGTAGNMEPCLLWQKCTDAWKQDREWNGGNRCS